MAPQQGVPCLVLLVSGKRKSGKDFVAEALRSRLGEDVCAILRLSGPLKEQYAQEHGLDFQRLLDASAYKEAYRRDMIRWGEEKRQVDPGFFCRKVVEGVSQPIWLVSDTRRLSDIQWFQEAYGAMTQTVRVVASEQSRKQRGWEFTPGVDDAESECGLDNFGAFDWVLENHGDEWRLEEQLENLVAFVQSRRRCRVPGGAAAAPLPDMWSPTPAEGPADARQARTPQGSCLLGHRTAPPL